MVGNQAKIEDINRWIQMNIIQNKLQLLVEIEEVDDIDFDALRLVDITYKDRKTTKYAEIPKIFQTMVHHLYLGKGKVIELEIIVFQELDGIYELDNYIIEKNFYFDVTVKNRDGSTIKKRGLEGIMNHLNYADWLYDHMVGQ